MTRPRLRCSSALLCANAEFRTNGGKLGRLCDVPRIIRERLLCHRCGSFVCVACRSAGVHLCERDSLLSSEELEALYSDLQPTISQDPGPTASEQIQQLQEETARLRRELEQKEAVLREISSTNLRFFSNSSDKTRENLPDWETYGDLLNCKAVLRAVRQTKCKADSCPRFLDVTVQYCDEHCRSLLYVYVARSTKRYAGCGLFAAVDLIPGIRIPYGGRILFFKTPTKKTNARAKLCECELSYLIDVRHPVAISGAEKYVMVDASQWDDEAHMGRFANHGTLSEQNGVLEYDSRSEMFWIKITKNIPRDCEIFVNYGAAFDFKLRCDCGRG